MNKLYAMLGILLIAISGVSANLCDTVVEESQVNQERYLIDLNEDGFIDLRDVSIFALNRDNDTWCEEWFGEPVVEQNIPYVTTNHRFKENLDRYSTVTMSRNVWGAVAREIQYEGVRYKVGLLWDYAWLVNEDGDKVSTPNGLKIDVEPRTFFTRTIKFSKE